MKDSQTEELHENSRSVMDPPCGPPEAPIQVRGRRQDRGQHRTGHARDGQGERCPRDGAPKRTPPKTAPKFSTEHTPPAQDTASQHWTVTPRKGQTGNEDEDGTVEVRCRQEVGTRGTPRWRRSQVRTGWRHGSAGGGPEKRDGAPEQRLRAPQDSAALLGAARV